MARDLYERLKHLRADRDHKTGEPATSSVQHHGPDLEPSGLEDWEPVRPLVFTRSVTVPVDGPDSASMQSRLLGTRVRFPELCFMDTETTGLSGGAGTLVFLVGTGYYRPGEVTVTQTFLADFPGEPEFLPALSEELARARIWVSYNGRAFDTHLLRTRFLMNGLTLAIPDQLDLLYWARRLWRRKIGRCGLEDVERNVLGLTREIDVPGFEIPDRYFSFLRSGDGAGLEPVFAHHLEDIVSLARLYFRIESLLKVVEEGGAVGIECDRVALGRYLAFRDPSVARGLLRSVVHNPRPDEDLADRERCAMTLTRIYRNDGEISAIGRVWERLWSEGSLLAGVEFAKYLEHREHRFGEAERVVESLLAGADSPVTRSLLEHRLKRLKRKHSSS